MPHLRKNDRSYVVNVGSISSFIGQSSTPGYTTSKHAVLGLSRSIALDYAADGIRCNCICPGTVDTPSLQQRLHDTGDYDAAQSAFVARQPMGRLGRAEEIAALVLYLASDEAAFTTGAVHVIDGGWVM